LKIGSQIGIMDRGSSEVIDMLTDPEGAPYKCIPHIDQSQVYKTVFDTLKDGHCIGIFPEGGSHDRTEILPLKGDVYIDKIVFFFQDSFIKYSQDSFSSFSWCYNNGFRCYC
jgi:hypothetical protein